MALSTTLRAAQTGRTSSSTTRRDLDRRLPKKEVLTVTDLANALAISERATRRHAEAWIDSGGSEGIPSFKVCGQYRFDRELLVDFLSQSNGFLVTADNADTSVVADR